MDRQSDSPQVFNRYLGLLGLSARQPSLDALKEIVAAHAIRFPFENISKLYYRKRSGLIGLPGLDVYLDGAERYHFGGTCYSNNYYLHRLLAFLGYDAMLCGADMTNPDVHLVNLVRVDGREYLVDVGYAAPFLEPIPRDLDDDYEIRLGRDHYILKPQVPDGTSRMELYRDGNLTHYYIAKPIPRKIDHFDSVIADSFSKSATFMNAILLVRFLEDRSIAINNLKIIESSGIHWTKTALRDAAELPAAIEEYFGIPRAMTESAIEDVSEFGDAWQ